MSDPTVEEIEAAAQRWLGLPWWKVEAQARFAISAAVREIKGLPPYDLPKGGVTR